MRPLRQLRGRPVHRRRLRRRAGRGARRARPRRASRSSPARCGRPGCRRSASTSRAGSRPASRPLPGRALGRLSDIGWGNRLRPMLAPAGSGRPVPDDVANAVVTVLADWAKGARRLGLRRAGRAGPPGRRGHHRLAQPAPAGRSPSGARIAEVGRMPLLGSVAYTDRRRPTHVLPQQQRPAAAGPARGARPCRRALARGAGGGRGPRAARRRPHRHRLDARGGRPAAAPGRAPRGCCRWSCAVQGVTDGSTSSAHRGRHWAGI